MRTRTTSSDEQLAIKALHYIDEYWHEQPSLGAMASQLGCDPYRLQRIFSRWTGLSPKKMIQLFTLHDAKARLQASHSVLDAAFATGLSGPGRLHDLFVTFEHMSPGEYKLGGAGLNLRYSFLPSPFGEMLAMQTDRGLCALAFTLEMGRKACLDDLKARWKRAHYEPDPNPPVILSDFLFSAAGQNQNQPLSVFLIGTKFQIQVWEALMRIPPACLTTYGGLAARIGRPASRFGRAIGSAVGANPLSWLIPCHRVIGQMGSMTGYRWGVACKIAMLGFEHHRGGSNLSV
ncbi:MAG: methylated-DNA--[protein]-cysteine S-methyltransferase [Pseudomonadota bacterium]